MKTRVFFSTLVLLIASYLLSGAATAKGREARTVIHVESATDAELTIENWMVNECYWKCMEFNCLARDYDEALELESWMTDASLWANPAGFVAEKESPLELEAWMTNVEARQTDLWVPVDRKSVV